MSTSGPTSSRTAQSLADRIDRCRRVDSAEFGGGVHLQCREPGVHLLARGLGDARRAVAADPLIDTDSVADRAAEQFVHRRVERFTSDIPQCLVDTRDCTHQDRPAAVEAAAIQSLPVIFDRHRVLTEQVVVHQFLDCAANRLHAPLDHWLTPTDESVTRLDSEKEPAWRDGEQFVVRNSHVGVLSRAVVVISGRDRHRERNRSTRHSE